MLDITFERSVNDQWHSIAQMAEQLIAFIKARRSKARSGDELISRIAKAIDWADEALSENANLIVLARRDLTEIETRSLEGKEELKASFIAAGKQLRDQSTVILAHREQWLDFMIQLNPEDAWAWTPEGASSLRSAETAVAEGRVARYASDEEFLTALERIHADANA